MKTKFSCQIILKVIMLIALGAVRSPAQMLPCDSLNTIPKFYLPPELVDQQLSVYGFDVKDSRDSIVLADDFICTSSNAITGIHIWGSWSNNVVGTITNFWIGIYSDVPAATNFSTGQVTNSHPGGLLWWTNFPQGQYSSGSWTNGYELYYNPINGSNYFDSLVYYYCFFPANPFIQQGSPSAPINYWLAIYAQQPKDGTFFGWKSAAGPSGDPAVWGTVGAGGLPNGNWQSLTNPITLQQLDLSMVLTTTHQLQTTNPTTVVAGTTQPVSWPKSPFAGGVISTNVIINWPSNHPVGYLNGWLYYTNLVIHWPWPQIDPDCISLGCPGSDPSVVNLLQAMGTNFSLLRFTTVLDQYSNQIGSFTTTMNYQTISSNSANATVNITENYYAGPTNFGFIDPTNWMFNVGGYTMLLHQSGPNTIVGTFQQPVYLVGGGYVLDVVSNTWTYPTGGGPGLAADEVDNVQMNAVAWNSTNSSLSFSATAYYSKLTQNLPTVCVEGSGVKYVQWPQLTNGFDMWDCSSFPPGVTMGPVFLADDFVCTNTGPITDIHLWGSWLNDWWVTNAITFWIGLYDNVPASVTNTFSHPGNLIYSNTFVPGHYVEGLVNVGQESFLAPQPGNDVWVGTDTKVWYYCFYPTNWYQSGSMSNPKTNWLAVFAQLPSGITNVFGWKTTANVQQDVSVYAPWPGLMPGFNPGWTPNYYYQTYAISNDLAFNINTGTNPPAQVPCPETNGVKVLFPPQAYYGGLDVRDSRQNYVLADDFPCTNNGAISDIHLWGSWSNNVNGTITNFWLAIYSDVPAATNYLNGQVANSHPGNLLWQQSFPGGQFWETEVSSSYPGAYEYFYDPTNGGLYWETNVWYYCFYPTNPFVQNGSIYQPTNYWLVARAQLANDGTFFGWKTSISNYNDAAVWGTVGGGGLPLGNWKSMTNPVTGQPINLSFKLTTTMTNPPPQTNCCPETNTVKWVQAPDLINGVDVDATYFPYDYCVYGPPNGLPWTLADDFPCTNSGSVKDIHIWGSWYNDWFDPNATFTLAIWSDVPISATNSASHPGVPLWSQSYLPGQYGLCVTNSVEPFQDAYGFPLSPDCTTPTVTHNLYHLCFAVPLSSNQTNTFYQTGTPAVKTNYWLSVSVQGTNYFGWKSSAMAYNDFALGSTLGVLPTNWTTFVYGPSGSQLNMAFMIGTSTNACTTPPQLQPTYLTVNCTNLSWSPPTPLPVDPCCPSNSGTWSMPVSFVISNCPTVYQYNWQYTNCQGLVAFGSSYVTVTSVPPVLVPSNIIIACGSPIPTNPPWVIDMCCSNIVPVWQYSYTNGNSCSNTISQVWKAVDCNCTNLFATVTQTVTVVDYTPPVITCASNKMVQCGTNWSFDLPTATDACCGTNMTITVVSTVTNGTCPWVITRTWKATDCCSNSASCSQTVTVMDTIPPVITCGTNKTVQCGTNWSFDLPTVSDACCGTNVTLTVVSTVTNGACPWVITRTWKATDCCSNSASCTQTVTVMDTIPPLITCASNKTVVFGTAWTFDPPTAYDLCCSNVTISVLSTVTNGTGCNLVITRTWQAMDCCSNSASCSQIVTVVCPPVPCVENNGVKYVQPPKIYNGYDVLNSGPWMLADDFVCTNSGPISDIHIWGSWLGDAVGTNTLTFWLAIYDDIPASVTNNYSHPGKLLWQQWFNPGQYAEDYSAYGYENFINPEPASLMGPDSQVWYYCFYPKCPLFQNGSVTAPKVYWLVAYAKPPTNSQFQYGWKTTFAVSNDISVHASWPGMPPTNYPAWTQNHDPQNVPLDLAFKITTDTDYNNNMKYIQWPNTNFSSGYDVWNSGPWVLADDFVCTNTGYITDIHLWGSWLSDGIISNSITFWIGLFNDVPAATNSGGPLVPSHPGGNLWSQCFPPGTYSESLWTPYTYEHFLDPGTAQLMGSDSKVWYYSFYPTNWPIQWGSATNPRIYWVGAFAQLPTGMQTSFGWKTTTNVQHDISVHSQWLLGQCPTNIPTNAFAWTPTYSEQGQKLDLAFEISTITNCSQSFLTIDQISTTTVQVQWGYGTLQWTTNLLTPFVDVPGAVAPFFRDTCYPVYPTNRFFRVKCPCD